MQQAWIQCHTQALFPRGQLNYNQVLRKKQEENEKKGAEFFALHSKVEMIFKR